MLVLENFQGWGLVVVVVSCASVWGFPVTEPAIEFPALKFPYTFEMLGNRDF